MSKIHSCDSLLHDMTPFQNPAPDSRRFSTPRLESFGGYEDDPVVDSTLARPLPPFQQVRRPLEASAPRDDTLLHGPCVYETPVRIDEELPRVPSESLLAAPLEQRVLSAERVPWIVPPPVNDGKTRVGPWSKWEEQEEDHFVYRGQDKHPNRKYCYYDRERHRELYFDELDRWIGLISPEGTFGRPAPRAAFWHGKSQKFSSCWMYPKREPAAADRGRTFPVPHSSSLPLLPVVARFPVADVPFDDHVDATEAHSSGGAGFSRVQPLSSRTAAEFPTFNLGSSMYRRPRSESPALSWGDGSDIAPTFRKHDNSRDEVLSSEQDHPKEAKKDELHPNQSASSPSERVNETLYLRTEEFASMIDWRSVRDVISGMAERVPGAHIVRVLQSSTPSGQALWFANATVHGARVLRSVIAPGSLREIRGPLMWATAEEFQAVSDGNSIASSNARPARSERRVSPSILSRNASFRRDPNTRRQKFQAVSNSNSSSNVRPARSERRLSPSTLSRNASFQRDPSTRRQEFQAVSDSNSSLNTRPTRSDRRVSPSTLSRNTSFRQDPSTRRHIRVPAHPAPRSRDFIGPSHRSEPPGSRSTHSTRPWRSEDSRRPFSSYTVQRRASPPRSHTLSPRVSYPDPYLYHHLSYYPSVPPYSLPPPSPPYPLPPFISGAFPPVSSAGLLSSQNDLVAHALQVALTDMANRMAGGLGYVPLRGVALTAPLAVHPTPPEVLQPPTAARPLSPRLESLPPAVPPPLSELSSLADRISDPMLIPPLDARISHPDPLLRRLQPSPMSSYQSQSLAGPSSRTLNDDDEEHKRGRRGGQQRKKRRLVKLAHEFELAQ